MTGAAYKISGGWFSEVFGRRVVKADATYLDHTRYNSGHAIGPFWHGQAGCGDDLRGTMESRGYVICSFSIGRDATIRQYLPVDLAAHHAYDASYRYSGVEHAVLPGSCDLTDGQMDSSAALFAGIIAYLGDRHGQAVPVDHVAGCDINSAGVKEHADGVGCGWNPNTHTDGLEWSRSGWDWPRFLAAIRALLEGTEDDMTNEQAQQLTQTLDFVRNLVRGINAAGAPPNDASDQERNGYAAGQKLLGVWQWQSGFSDGVAGKPKPSDPEAAKGWAAAKG